MRTTTSRTLNRSIQTTTSCVGRMGVMPARTRKVASAEPSATATAKVPNQPDPRCPASMSDGRALSWGSFKKGSSLGGANQQRPQLARPLMQHHNTVVKLIHFRGESTAPPNALSPGTDHLQIEVADFLA